MYTTTLHTATSVLINETESGHSKVPQKITYIQLLTNTIKPHMYCNTLLSITQYITYYSC